jgi:hypothetical protein
MSILNVNTIQSAAGATGTVLIPSGYNLSIGGTAISSSTIPPTPGSGNTGKFLKSDGSVAGFASTGASSIQSFTSSGTWVKPTGITKILVRICGGGGAASGHGESGGAGGYAEKIIDVSTVTSVVVTVGAGSTSPTYYSGTAGAGGTSSFGSYVSASGGNGANSSHQHCGGLSGVGTGGDLNLYGGGGTGHYNHQGDGGASFFGGSGAGGWPNTGNSSTTGWANTHSFRAPAGAGGTSGHQTSHQGGNGKGGIVIVWEFT